MANVIRKAKNKFTKGLIMDFSPENTKNEVLTHALNATLLTFNGNELSLLNDMGNVKVETAYLPEGYIPVGVCEYGGIVYIVSYNPLEDKSLIGCFPSPERNISNDELGKNNVKIISDEFVKDGIVTNTSYLALLKDDHLNPGDKFIIHSDNLYQNNLQDLFYLGELKEHPRIALNVVSIEDSGKIVYLNSDIKQYKKGDYEYHILETENIALDISNYRNAISSGYSIFKSKTSGRLAILAELVTIDSYSVTHSVIPTNETSSNVFDIVIHTDVEPVLNESNKLQAPKLKYYYLENSQGVLSTFDDNNNEILLHLMQYDSHLKEWTKSGFNDVLLSELFATTQENLKEELKKGLLEDSFQFPLPKTYHGLMRAVVNKDSLNLAITCLFKNQYYKIDKSQIQNNLEYFSDSSVFRFYEYDISLDEKTYNLITDIKEYNRNNTLFVVCDKNVTLNPEQFIPDTNYNNIQGFEKEYIEEYPKDDAIKCLWDDYIPSLNPNSDEYLSYPDIKLASIKFPEVLYQHGVDLPFKYDYTIVPCMDYGKLPSLAVSNTVDFSKLHDFKKSDFNVWKYKVTEDLLKLTIGTEVFDVFSSDKVNGLHIEFYDHRGFAGSLEINNKKSYSGLFTKILQLNTRDVLSKNKLVKGKIISNYKHNVNIDENNKLAEKEVKHDESGWNIDDSDNDCGTLFSNLLYIAKAYLRVSKANGEEGYIEKNQFSLFTMPLLNDYYNSISNYNEISDLQLDLLLTYKLTDNGTLKEYNATNYVLGYSSLSDGNKSDLDKVREYKSGKWDNPSLQVTKYYQYTGISKLQLEVGLKEEYSKYGFFYDSTINNEFSCDITLMNDLGDNSVLMYKNGELVNSNKTNVMELSNVPTSNFQEYNFINTSGTNSIAINYTFVVNYGITVEDIAVIEIPCTTICALCHQNDAGDYNYSDFGIYQNNEEFYSDVMFYNSGTDLEEIFGICKQNTKTGSVQSQVSTTSSYSQASTATSNYGKLNAGDPLKSVANRIPKLSFVLPHAHGIDTNSFTGIVDITYSNVPTTEGSELPIFGTSYNELDGTGKAHVKTSAYFPRYTSSMLTKNVVDYQSVFIPTINRKITHHSLYYDRMEAFDGFSGTLLLDFNKKLLLTMKSVYVYNPDYSSQIVNEGKLNIENAVYTFTNNIVSSNAKLNIEYPEDYIYLHSFSFTKYKELLLTFASISEDILPTLSFNLEYCGELKYLITPLSYDLKTPNTLGKDLNIDFSDLILVKTESGLIPVNGTLNKKSLYGWDANTNNLIKLNPLNHIIDKDGSVVLHNQTGRRYELFSKYTLASSNIPNDAELASKEFTLTYKFNPNNEIESANYYDILECEVKFKIHDTSGSTNYKIKVLDKDVIICKYNPGKLTTPLKLECATKVIRGTDTKFEAYLPKILFKMCAKTLKEDLLKIVSDWDVNKLIEAASRKVGNDLQKNPSNLDPIIMNGVPLKSNTRHEWANLVGINEFQLFDDEVFESLHGLTAYEDNDGILVYHIELNFWDFAFERKEDIITQNNVIINNDIKGYDYQIFDELLYKVKIDSENTLLRGTSICLSDLEYDPYSEHRLYIKQNFRIPHLKIGLTMDYLNKLTSDLYWNKSLSDSNKLRFHLGPCFTPDNL